MLVLELSIIIFDKKDKVKDLNQRFINLLNHIPENTVESIQVEFYTTTLPPPIAMFVKKRGKRTIAKIFLEAIKVEKGLPSI